METRNLPLVHYSGMLFCDRALNIRIFKAFVTTGKGLLFRIKNYEITLSKILYTSK